MTPAFTLNPGPLAILFAAFVWATTGTAASFAPEVSAHTIGAAAMGLGGLLQALRARKDLVRERAALSAQRGLLLFGALAVAIYPLAFYSSMRMAGVAIGTVLTIASAPLFAALIEMMLDRSPPSRRWWQGAGIASLGVLLLGISSHASAGTNRPMGLGILLGLLAGLTYAGYSWSARKMMQQGTSSRAAMGATFGLGGLLLMPVLLVSGAPLLNSPLNAAVGLYMVLVPMYLGYIAYGYGLARVTASTATLITLAEPAIATLLAVWVVGERITPLGLIGMGLILVSLIWLARETGKDTS